MADFETQHLPVDRTAIAPDGSDVRVLLGVTSGGMAHFELGANQWKKSGTFSPAVAKCGVGRADGRRSWMSIPASASRYRWELTSSFVRLATNLSLPLA